MLETMARTETRTGRPDLINILPNYICRVTKPLNSQAFQGLVAWRIVTITLLKIKQNYNKNFRFELFIFIDQVKASLLYGY
jgi:hypothetical protein